MCCEAAQAALWLSQQLRQESLPPQQTSPQTPQGGPLLCWLAEREQSLQQQLRLSWMQRKEEEEAQQQCALLLH
jgi:hypothetical protein